MENKYRTYPSKGLIIALSCVLVISIGMLVLFIVINENIALKIFMYVMFAIFIIASTIVLLDQLTHYVEVDGECFKKHLLFMTKTININEIEKISYKNDFFDVFVKGKKFAYFSADTEEGKRIIKYLDSKRVNIKW